jgi:hypothetical protein
MTTDINRRHVLDLDDPRIVVPCSVTGWFHPFEAGSPLLRPNRLASFLPSASWSVTVSSEFPHSRLGLSLATVSRGLYNITFEDPG